MKLKDEELTRLAAEKIMGWICRGEHTWTIDGVAQASSRCWSPLTDWRAAGEIVEKMRADGWNGISGWDSSGHSAMFSQATRLAKHNSGPSAPRAITLAALLAVGAITKEQL